MVVQASGKIVVVGNADTGGPALTDFALARYNPNGSLDTSFSGDDGRQTTGFQDFDEATAVALQASGKIVVVGYDGGTGGDFALARYNPNGTLDAKFSGDGRQTTEFGSGDYALEVVLQGDGKIIAVGVGGAGDGDFALARYNPNGSLDTSFSGTAGRRLTSGASTEPAGGAPGER